MISRDYPADEVIAFTGLPTTNAANEAPPERAAVVADGECASGGGTPRSVDDSTPAPENPAFADSFPDGAESPLPEWLAVALRPETVPSRGVRIDSPAQARALLGVFCGGCGEPLRLAYHTTDGDRCRACAQEIRIRKLEKLASDLAYHSA